MADDVDENALDGENGGRDTNSREEAVDEGNR